jgi:hypothetical protein
MIRWKSAVLGAVVFVTAHLVLMAGWREWFLPGGDFPPWFLNSGRAVVLTAVLLFIAGAFVGLTTRGTVRESLVASGNLAAGAIVAMCVVLALTGLGTLFPIALTIGAGVVVMSIAAGALAGSAIRKGYRGQ